MRICRYILSISHSLSPCDQHFWSVHAAPVSSRPWSLEKMSWAAAEMSTWNVASTTWRCPMNKEETRANHWHIFDVWAHLRINEFQWVHKFISGWNWVETFDKAMVQKCTNHIPRLCEPYCTKWSSSSNDLVSKSILAKIIWPRKLHEIWIQAVFPFDSRVGSGTSDTKHIARKSNQIVMWTHQLERSGKFAYLRSKPCLKCQQE